ncbi:MAG: WD40 repeat domain-containing protein [Cyanobacteriota bacterium]|nr:WD40 repeat domain-containing protein [Cyanobacteriota bacterium]
MKIEEKYCISARDDYISNLAFHPDGEILATCGYDEIIRLWDIKTGKKIRAFNRRDYVRDIAFSPDGKILASAEYERIILRKVDTGKIFSRLNLNELTLSCSRSYVYAVAFSPNSHIVAGSDGDNRISWFNVKTGVLIKTLNHSDDELCYEINDLEFSPDGKILASCSEDRTIKLWEFTTGKLIRTLTGHTEDVYGIAFSPNGCILASYSWDNTIKFWDVSTGKKIRTLESYDYSVSCVAFHPNGKILASGSEERIQLWDVETGKEICTLNNHSQESNHSREVKSVVFSPDGQLLVSADKAGIVRIWHGDLPKMSNIEIVRLIKNPKKSQS